MMNNTIKVAIADLPDDAPATAVIAAWVGKDVKYDNFSDYAGMTYRYRNNDKQVYHSRVPHSWYTDLPMSPETERTLRRWLLDGDMLLSSWKFEQKYVERVYAKSFPTKWDFNAQADTPEAAFSAAVEQFASALRDGAKTQ